MNLDSFKKSFSELRTETSTYKKLCYGLIAANLVIGVFLFTKETTVVVQPWTLTATAQLEKSSANREYKEAWGLALAELLGNITPENVDFVVERLKPLLAPDIYNNTVRNAEEQAIMLKEDRITQSFVPRTVEYEPSTGKVFVKGRSFVTGASSYSSEREEDSGEKSEVTYEFEIQIANYMPIVKSIEVYAGQARTGKVLRRMEQAQKRKEAREAKRKAKEER